MRPPAAEEVAILICEDVRPGLSGRSDYLGVFGPSIEIERIPAMMPMLCGSVLVLNAREPITHIAAQFMDPAGKPLLAVESDVGPSVDEQASLASYSFKMFPVKFDVEGEYRFFVRFNRTADIGVERSIRVRVKSSNAQASSEAPAK